MIIEVHPGLAEAQQRARPGFSYLLLTLLLLLGLLAPLSSAADSTNVPLSQLKRSIIDTYSDIAFATYRDSLSAASNLNSTIGLFLSKPDAESLEKARQAWIAARVPYSQTEVFRFYDGPIDQLEGLINAWPIDENYIDYVSDNPSSGIINGTAEYPQITRDLIVSLNEKEGKENISAGFHAIEFLLWGQDTSASGPGDRSWRDYAPGTTNAARRVEYLRLVSALLVSHLETVTAAWQPDQKNNYRAEFTTVDPDTALARILKGIGAFSGPELSGERLTVAYETKEQEEEQDCFSDNTCADILNDAIGLQNVYFGHYTSASGEKLQGPGIHDLLRQLDLSLASRLASQIDATVAIAKSIPAPFDQAILGNNQSPGRIAIKKAIAAFQADSDLIASAAKSLSLNLNL